MEPKGKNRTKGQKSTRNLPNSQELTQKPKILIKKPKINSNDENRSKSQKSSHNPKIGPKGQKSTKNPPNSQELTQKPNIDPKAKNQLK